MRFTVTKRNNNGQTLSRFTIARSIDATWQGENYFKSSIIQRRRSKRINLSPTTDQTNAQPYRCLSSRFNEGNTRLLLLTLFHMLHMLLDIVPTHTWRHIDLSMSCAQDIEQRANSTRESCACQYLAESMGTVDTTENVHPCRLSACIDWLFVRRACYTGE